MELGAVTADDTVRDAGPETAPFHATDGWFAPWREAYLEPGCTGLTVAGLPVMADRGRLGPLLFRRLRSQTNVHSALFDGLEGQPVPADAAAQLLAGRDLVTLDYVPEASPLLAAARSWSAKARVVIAPHAVCPLADCRGPFDQWMARRSRRSRQRWPMLERKLVGEMGLTFRVQGDPFGAPEGAGLDDLDALLDEIFAVEQSGWKGRERTAILDDPRDAKFYRELAHRAAAAGALRIVTLSLNGRIKAFEYGVIGGDRLFLLKVGFNEVYERYSIGHLLAVMHIRHCCQDPLIAWYDKMGNGMTPAAYKLRFNDTIDTLYRITLYGNGWRGRLLQARDRAREMARTLRNRWRQRLGQGQRQRQGQAGA